MSASCQLNKTIPASLRLLYTRGSGWSMSRVPLWCALCYHATQATAVLCLLLAPVVSHAGDFALTGVAPCTEADTAACKEECRREFADAFLRCTNQCLGTRCDPNPPPSTGDKSVDEPLACLEIESASCSAECQGEDSALATRCRYSCLGSRCPASRPFERGRESRDPGILTCERCREKNRTECLRSCQIGLTTFDGRYPGLVSLGCEKLCLMAACEKECGTRVP